MKIASITINFGGKTRLMVFDYEARAQLHDLSGTYFSDTPSLRVLRDMLWACLRSATLDENLRETKDTLSRAQVGELLAAIEDNPEELQPIKAALEKVRDIAEPPTADPPQAANPPL
jgi:hypothetical protein